MIPETPRHPILETERLCLAPLTAADAADIFAMMADPQVMAYWDQPTNDDPDFTDHVVKNQVSDMAAGRAVHWSLRALADNSFVGCAALGEIDRRHRRAEVGFMLGREAWGQGFAQEAMRAIVAFAGSSGLRRLTARTHLGNRASENVLRKLGFQEEGLLRGHVLRDGERRDCRLFGLLL